MKQEVAASCRRDAVGNVFSASHVQVVVFIVAQHIGPALPCPLVGPRQIGDGFVDHHGGFRCGWAGETSDGNVGFVCTIINALTIVEP